MNRLTIVILEKYLLALKCLLAAAKLAPEDPAIHGQVLRFKKTLEADYELLPAQVTSVIDAEFYPTLFPSKDTDLAAFNDGYLTRHKGIPTNLFGGNEFESTNSCNKTDVYVGLLAKYFLNPTSTPEIEVSVLESIKGGLDMYTLQDAYDGLALLKDIKGSERTIEEYISVVKGKWVYANGLV